MTIRPGEEWGRPADGHITVTATATDAELAGLVAAGNTGPFELAAGDLHRAVGSPPAGSRHQVVPVDALVVRLDDGPEQVAVAHVVARRPGPLGAWRGPLLAVCNGDHVGRWNVAPRAHPNDGRADVVEVASMSLRTRWQAWRRLPHGTHVPHPSIATRSVRAARFEFTQPRRVWIDGISAGECRSLDLAVRPDAFELVV